MSTREPLMEETEAGYGEALTARRMRVLRVVVGTFLTAILVGAVLTASRLMRIVKHQNYVDANYPACRKGYALASYVPVMTGESAKLIVWSGKSESNCMANELCDDLWQFDLEQREPTDTTSRWAELDQENAGGYLHSNVRPEPRWKTVAVQDREQNMYIFAGDPLREDGGFIDDVWRLQIETLRWQRLATTCEPEPEDLGSCGSLRRRAHAAVMIGQMIYVHGGKDPSSDLLNDVWVLDTLTLEWTRLHLVGPALSARSRACARSTCSSTAPAPSRTCARAGNAGAETRPADSRPAPAPPMGMCSRCGRRGGVERAMR
jgi:hypothetical protein